MTTEDSDVKCPFCKTTMTSGYVTMQGCRGGSVYFSTEKTSTGAWLAGPLGTLGKKKETVLTDYPGGYSKSAYKCYSCGAIVLEGEGEPAEEDSANAAEVEKETRRENEDLRDQAREMAGY